MRKEKRKNIIKVNSKTNTLLNIVVCLLIIWLSNFNLIAIIIAFICYDAISIILNKMILSFKIHKIKNINDLKKEKEILGDKLYGGYDEQEKNYLKEAYKKMNAKLDKELEKAKRELEEQEEAASMKQKGKKQYDSFKNGIILLEDFKSDHEITNIKKYNNLLAAANKLDKAIVRNISGIIFVDSTFSVYVKELINLLTAYEASSDEVKLNYKEKIKELMDAFIDYINRTIEKVESYNKNSIDITYNVLMNELKSANK